MIYFVFAIVATGFSYLAVHVKYRNSMYKNNHVNGIFILFSFASYFIPAAIRYGIGQDYFYTYAPMFNWIKNDSVSVYTNKLIEYNEVGFTLLNKVIAFFTQDYQWLFVVTSLICLGLAYKCICDYSVNVQMSVFMMFLGSYYLGSYSLIRQSIAIVIFLYAIRYIEKNKLIKYMICMVIAISIHSISYIYIPFYFLGKIKLSKRQYYLIAICSIVGMNLFSSLVIKVVSYSRFINRVNFSSHYNILLSIVVLFVFVIAVHGLSDKEDIRYRIYLNILFVSACLIGLSAYLDTTDRVIFSYYYTNFITIPYFYKKAKWGKNRSIIVFLLFALLTTLWCYEHLYYDQFSILPYTNIFMK